MERHLGALGEPPLELSVLRWWPRLKRLQVLVTRHPHADLGRVEALAELHRGQATTCGLLIEEPTQNLLLNQHRLLNQHLSRHQNPRLRSSEVSAFNRHAKT